MYLRFALLPLICLNASASLILTLSDPSHVTGPGTHAIYHGTLQNTDPVTYNVVSFSIIASPTDSITPPTADQLFPIAEPAVPFQIAPGAVFTGVLVDITVPTTAQFRDHPFGIEAATDVNGLDGFTIVSNTALADLNVGVPEPDPAALTFLGLAVCCFPALRKISHRCRLRG